jgi:catechol 2,3-dioxygenase-like lactoylglutathione lyase family enzyme
MPVTQLISVSLTVADIAKIAAFYRNSLGLMVGLEQTLEDPAWNSLLGLESGARVHAADVMIGRQTIQLTAIDPPGKPYPPERASNDQWFQHFALVCRDIAKVESRSRGDSPCVITSGGPVLLPPNTGSVTAFKFRDPEGHPLELISFPDGVGAPIWQGMPGTGILGYDHTAISVMDVERSTAFYTGLLGFHVGGRSLNRGPQQDRLDGFTGCEVDVVALEPAADAVPHVELLHYRTPRGRTLVAEVKASDVASARQIHKVKELDSLTGRLKSEGVRFVSPGLVNLNDGGKAVTIRDPDGHMLVLME